MDPARREALAAGFTGALHVLGVVLAVLSAAGAVLTHRALRERGGRDSKVRRGCAGGAPGVSRGGAPDGPMPR